MRFKRSDLPGFIIAVGAPPLLFLLFLRSFEVWHHQGTPLLGFMATNIAGAVATLAIFSRFIRNWDFPLILLAVLGGIIGGVLWAQQSGNDGTAFATTLKWLGIGVFLLLNLLLGLQVLQNGLLPVLDRRDARRSAAETDS
ncbi:MAG: hypothetical protein AB7L91_03935 [Dehalococcoidia bacterium]